MNILSIQLGDQLGDLVRGKSLKNMELIKKNNKKDSDINELFERKNLTMKLKIHE